MDAYQNYWKEALACALDELGLYHALTPEQYDAAAKSLMFAAEQQSMAFGHDCIPDPRDEVEAKLKAKIVSAENETQLWKSNFRKNVAMRHNCTVQDVDLEENGHATVYNSKL